MAEARAPRPLRTYILLRVIQGVPLILAVIIFTFLLIHLAPGDPATILAGEMAPPEFVQRIRVELGLDQPLYVQLVIYLSKVLQGDLGFSYSSREPVLFLIWSRLPNTVLLVGVQLIFAVLIGIIAGVVSSQRPYSVGDAAGTLAALAGYSVPVFWLGQILMLVFSLDLRLLPAQGMQSFTGQTGWIYNATDLIRHLILPSVSLAVYTTAIVFRFTRASMLDVLKQDFITMARSKGLRRRVVMYKHALRNGLIPIVTVIGLQMRYLVTGAVLTETVFGWPGLGRLTYDAILARDYPILLGIFIVITAAIIVVNIIVDITYAVVDPRVRYQ